MSNPIYVSFSTERLCNSFLSYALSLSLSLSLSVTHTSSLYHCSHHLLNWNNGIYCVWLISLYLFLFQNHRPISFPISLFLFCFSLSGNSSSLTFDSLLQLFLSPSSFHSKPNFLFHRQQKLFVPLSRRLSSPTRKRNSLQENRVFRDQVPFAKIWVIWSL